jgi:2-polyprenyl-3-methyl-5-hydroxy-6-metoxy-1,4-benzoquinol methylase
MPILSDYARKRKIAYFIGGLPKQSKILEVGCGGGWLGSYLKSTGYTDYVGLDVADPADVAGNILEWRALGIEPESFDVIVAFELIEHVDCVQEMFDILKPGGLLMLTSPLPHMDWLCSLLERLGLSQKRTSPHCHLIYFKDLPLFEPLEMKIIGGIAQWGKFRKPTRT